MSVPLWQRIGIGNSELVSIVGAGGKTTTMLTLGRELARNGDRVALTTTTRMARTQLSEPVCWSADATVVRASLVDDTPLFVLSHLDGEKVFGLTPTMVDRLFTEGSVDHVVVEADGARTRSIKAPAAHEPAIPSLSTTVIVVVGADALGRPLAEVAHRPERVAAIAGMAEDDVLTPALVARVVADADGGLKNLPPGARAVVVISKGTGEHATGAAELGEILRTNPHIDRVVTT